MTPEQLRADADRLEALAQAATPGPWTPMRGEGTPFVLAANGSVVETHPKADTLRGLDDVCHIAANDPSATLRRVAEMRLLADCIDCVGAHSLHLTDPVFEALYLRFDAMEANDGDL